MTTLPQEKPEDNGERRPYRMRLPGFVSDETIGLGDVATRATKAFGVAPCGGCNERAAALNRWLVFSGRRRR